MSYRSPCVPAYRYKFCSVWWIVSGSPRSRPRRRWDRGPVILAFACILAYRGPSKKTTSRHSRSQLPAVFSPVRPLFQRGLDSPTTIKNEIYDTDLRPQLSVSRRRFIIRCLSFSSLDIPSFHPREVWRIDKNFVPIIVDWNDWKSRGDRDQARILLGGGV